MIRPQDVPGPRLIYTPGPRVLQGIRLWYEMGSYSISFAVYLVPQGCLDPSLFIDLHLVIQLVYEPHLLLSLLFIGSAHRATPFALTNYASLSFLPGLWIIPSTCIPKIRRLSLLEYFLGVPGASPSLSSWHSWIFFYHLPSHTWKLPSYETHRNLD